MILKSLTKNAQRVRVGHSDVVCLPANDFDEIINQFNKLYYEKPSQIKVPSAPAPLTKPRDPNALLNIREVAEFLGVGKSTMYSYLKHPGAPKPIKLGRSTRYRYSELLDFSVVGYNGGK